MQNGVIWGHFRVSYNIESSTILKTDRQEFLKIVQNLTNYVRSTRKNDRLSSLGLVHIHRDFEVDLYKAMEVFVSAKTRRADFGQF
jgi:hypothetical protein